MLRTLARKRSVEPRRLLGIAVASSLGLVVMACNALTGVSDLATCEVCGDLSDPARADGGDGSSVVNPPTNDGGPTALPAACEGDEIACEGRVAARCVAGAWEKTPCAEACNAGECDAWPSCRNVSGASCAVAGKTTSCCATAAVPGGTFNRRGSSSTPATVSAFELDKYEVTVGRMRAFVDGGAVSKANPPAAGAGAHPRIPNSGWNPVWNAFLPADVTALRATLDGSYPTWTAAPGANEHLPINNVSWFVAFAFCAWDGGRLPTYAELNFAAAGGSEQRVYPWSVPPNDATVTGSRAAYECGYEPPSETCPASYCSDNSSTPCDPATCLAPNTCQYPGCTGCAFADIAAVGSLPSGAGRWGHFELAGNVAELVLDVDSAGGSGGSFGLPVPCVDCAKLPPTVLKGSSGGKPRMDAYFLSAGGSWAIPSYSLRSSQYASLRDDRVDSNVGFRCAR
jgi:formylglycine-generating enzyme required for sulfatase activity